MPILSEDAKNPCTIKDLWYKRGDPGLASGCPPLAVWPLLRRQGFYSQEGRGIKFMNKINHVHNEPNLATMARMADNSIDAIVTDPPYGLKFMGKKWDHDVPGVDIWRECLRVLKPGGYLLAFAGTRTQHRMACAIEDAGFEIRDMIAWVYGSGFPKSLDISKAIDKAAGADVSTDGYIPNGKNNTHGNGWGGGCKTDTPVPTTDAARQWNGWGTALKPALEPITMARKPFPGTVAANVEKWGTGGLNVEACRVGTEKWTHPGSNAENGIYGDFKNDSARTGFGRFPANLIHDGSDEVMRLFPDTGVSSGGTKGTGRGGVCEMRSSICATTGGLGDSGSAARFFYCAKASRAERDLGLADLPIKSGGDACDREDGTDGLNSPRAGAGRNGRVRNFHPTVKPIDLMRYLCKLVTPPDGIVYDPFCGSGTTLVGAKLEGFQWVGSEMDPEYAEIARKRVEAVHFMRQMGLFD
jgi:DNA modification methylase